MSKINLFRTQKNSNLTRDLADKAMRSKECKLKPVALSGVVIPWERPLDDGPDSNYKLVCSSGLEYFFIKDKEWEDILKLYSWEEVKVIGLLNSSDHTIIPQKVFPKGPTGEREKVIDLSEWRGRSGISQFARTLKELIVFPAAICAAWAS